MLNVAFGGGLLHHIPGDTHRALDEGRGDSRWHDVLVEADSVLGRIIGGGRVQTNSRHHQAVPGYAVGERLVVTAIAEDGIVEGLEAPAHRWVLAVQWHPERDEVAARFRPLFEAFVAAAAAAPTAVGRT